MAHGSHRYLRAAAGAALSEGLGDDQGIRVENAGAVPGAFGRDGLAMEVSCGAVSRGYGQDVAGFHLPAGGVDAGGEGLGLPGVGGYGVDVDVGDVPRRGLSAAELSGDDHGLGDLGVVGERVAGVGVVGGADHGDVGALGHELAAEGGPAHGAGVFCGV